MPPGSRCASWDGAPRSPGGQLERLDELIVALVTARAPGLVALYGVGPDTAALLLITAGDHPERLRSEAAWAHLCAVAPIPASSGKVTRHRLNPGGDRQANHALWRIVITRMSSHPPTRSAIQGTNGPGGTPQPDQRGPSGWLSRSLGRCYAVQVDQLKPEFGDPPQEPKNSGLIG
jgi:hypothetical protein